VVSLSSFLFLPASWLLPPARSGILNIGEVAVSVAVLVSTFDITLVVDFVAVFRGVLGTICAFRTFCSKLAGRLPSGPIGTGLMVDNGDDKVADNVTLGPAGVWNMRHRSHTNTY